PCCGVGSGGGTAPPATTSPPASRSRTIFCSVLRDVQFLHPAGDQENHALADVGGAVGDAFEVVGDPEEPGGTFDGLGVGDHVQDQLVVDLGVELVDQVVLGGD